MTTVLGQKAATTARPSIDPGVRRARPVKIWAAVGALWLSLLVYMWSVWLMSGDARPSPRGPTPVPHWQEVAARVWEASMVIATIVVAWLVLIRPWVRDRRISTDGMLFIAWLTMWMIQDPWANYTQQYFNYNNAFLNLGCPQCHVPGWQSANGANMAEPILFTGGMYLTALFMGSVVCCAAMRWAKKRWPQMGALGLMTFAYLFILVIDFGMELPWLRFGLYSYSGSIRELSFFSGHYYQFPIYEGLLWGAAWTGMACLRYFKDDRGNTWAERGLEQIKAPEWQKQGLRLLALIGIANTIFVVLCNIPTIFMAQHSDSYPDDVLDKSYLTNGMCGLGTDYACPDPRVPMVVGHDSVHVTPQGTMSIPAGTPRQVP